MSSSDISEITEELKLLNYRLNILEEIFSSDDEFNTINRIHDKLNVLLSGQDRSERIMLAEKTLNKFEDYMKNVDKLNAMINEFKGCVTVARAAIAERKQKD
jgi:hypothetical protein